WFLVDMRCDYSVALHQLHWAIDGMPEASVTSNQGVAGDFMSATIGNQSNTQTFVAYYDDVALSTAAAAYPLGSGQVLAHRPDGTGAVNTTHGWSTDNGVGWTAFVAGDANRTPGRAALLDDWPVTVGAAADLARGTGTAAVTQYSIENWSEQV